MSFSLEALVCTQVIIKRKSYSPLGTGKSFVLRILKDMLIEKYSANTVFVTAATGIAGTQLVLCMTESPQAIAIGGTTLHSFAGVGLGTTYPPNNAVYLNAMQVTERRK